MERCHMLRIKVHLRRLSMDELRLERTRAPLAHKRRRLPACNLTHFDAQAGIQAPTRVDRSNIAINISINITVANR